jgi:hypothetical protein
MKEYITLINFTKMSLSGKTSDAIVVNYYKDSDRTILHREKNKPAVIWSNGDKYYWQNHKFLVIKKI